MNRLAIAGRARYKRNGLAVTNSEWAGIRNVFRTSGG
jgi:hypothetical protein